MSDDNRAFTKEEEEHKRDAVLNRDPVARYKRFLEFLESAIANIPPERRRNRPRLPHQK